MGEEKHYLTQVYHEDHSTFPYTDYDYYNSQPEILEEYTYLNRKDSIISDFSVNNITEARSYYPNKYESAIFSTSHKALPEEGYSILMNTGAHSVWPNGIDVGNYASNKADISFTGLNPGAYYEVQNRASAASDWKTVSPAVLATTEGEKITEKDVVDLASEASVSALRDAEMTMSDVGVLGIVALGAGMLIIAGEFDLSVGSMIGFAGGCMAMILK